MMAVTCRQLFNAESRLRWRIGDARTSGWFRHALARVSVPDLFQPHFTDTKGTATPAPSSSAKALGLYRRDQVRIGAERLGSSFDGGGFGLARDLDVGRLGFAVQSRGISLGLGADGVGLGALARAERLLLLEKLGNRRCRLDPRARNQHHGALAGVDHLLLDEFCECSSGAGRCRLGE